MALRYFMLGTGYEMIGEVEDGDQYDVRKLKNPMRLLMTNNGYMLTLCPIGEAIIENIHVLLEGTVADGLANLYREKTGGVVIPEQKMVFPN